MQLIPKELALIVEGDAAIVIWMEVVILSAIIVMADMI
jgi:hypothetical protein